MGLDELALEFGRQGQPRRIDRRRAEDRPVLEHQPHLAVAFDRLLQLGLELAAIRALIIEPFDNRDIAVGVAGDWNIRVAQNGGFVEHVAVIGWLADGRHRRDVQPQRERACAQQAERASPRAHGVHHRRRPARSKGTGHGGSPGPPCG